MQRAPCWTSDPSRRTDKEEEEDETVAYLDHDSDNEVDLSALPDPDKYRNVEEDEQPTEESSSDGEEVPPRKRPFSSISKEKEEKTVAAKKAKATQRSEEPFEPLNTGLSLAEDEELVLHLLNSSS